ncbi:uncharacterized protein LOC134821558 [Bolinopsis microptera]|uniref:uncharacterized protein LOC134821558 n=1 Tax=Bolinopsis microptera TaxID=2820187 RepID=UPI00307913DE
MSIIFVVVMLIVPAWSCDQKIKGACCCSMKHYGEVMTALRRNPVQRTKGIAFWPSEPCTKESGRHYVSTVAVVEDNHISTFNHFVLDQRMKVRGCRLSYTWDTQWTQCPPKNCTVTHIPPESRSTIKIKVECRTSAQLSQIDVCPIVIGFNDPNVDYQPGNHLLRYPDQGYEIQDLAVQEEKESSDCSLVSRWIPESARSSIASGQLGLYNRRRHTVNRCSRYAGPKKGCHCFPTKTTDIPLTVNKDEVRTAHDFDFEEHLKCGVFCFDNARRTRRKKKKKKSLQP